MNLDLKGKKALVCASSKGLGRAVAESLAEEGVSLVLCARDNEQLQSSAQAIRDRYQVPVHALALDLAAAGAPQRLAQFAQDQLGTIDILVNNVGGPAPSAAHATSEAAWRLGFDQIFMSSTLLTSELLPGMRERRFGRIITITSISVVEPIEHLAVSTAMRAAVTGFAKTLATEVAKDGVTVNTVLPGIIHTQRIEDLRRARAERNGTVFEDEMAKTAKEIPVGRLGRPEELAHLVTFLASPKASYITGEKILIDGGLRRGL